MAGPRHGPGFSVVSREKDHTKMRAHPQKIHDKQEAMLSCDPTPVGL
jgi:hypothetical protein